MTTACSIAGCTRPQVTRGWCRLHYVRWQRHGDPLYTKQPNRGDMEARFFAMVDMNGPFASNHPELGRCHLWMGSLSEGGYGRIGEGRKKVWLAHRWAYERWVGPVAEGLELDHFACDLRHCVNPAHVRPVTRRENSLRGETIAARAAAKTHCPQGHPYDEKNTYAHPIKGGRSCRQCHREKVRAAYRAKRQGHDPTPSQEST